MKRICPVCKTEFTGRVDKKFCCDQCRNTYNNRLNQEEINYSRLINKILKNNRNILNCFHKKNLHKIHKDKLFQNGFNFDYLTNIYKTKTGKIYYFCYDLGYYYNDEDYCIIVEKKEYV